MGSNSKTVPSVQLESMDYLLQNRKSVNVSELPEWLYQLKNTKEIEENKCDSPEENEKNIDPRRRQELQHIRNLLRPDENSTTGEPDEDPEIKIVNTFSLADNNKTQTATAKRHKWRRKMPQYESQVVKRFIKFDQIDGYSFTSFKSQAVADCFDASLDSIEDADSFWRSFRLIASYKAQLPVLEPDLQEMRKGHGFRGIPGKTEKLEKKIEEMLQIEGLYVPETESDFRRDACVIPLPSSDISTESHHAVASILPPSVMRMDLSSVHIKQEASPTTKYWNSTNDNTSTEGDNSSSDEEAKTCTLRAMSENARGYSDQRKANWEMMENASSVANTADPDSVFCSKELDKLLLEESKKSRNQSLFKVETIQPSLVGVRFKTPVTQSNYIKTLEAALQRKNPIDTKANCWITPDSYWAAVNEKRKELQYKAENKAGSNEKGQLKQSTFSTSLSVPETFLTVVTKPVAQYAASALQKLNNTVIPKDVNKCRWQNLPLIYKSRRITGKSMNKRLRTFKCNKVRRKKKYKTSKLKELFNQVKNSSHFSWQRLSALKSSENSAKVNNKPQQRSTLQRNAGHGVSDEKKMQSEKERKFNVGGIMEMETVNENSNGENMQTEKKNLHSGAIVIKDPVNEISIEENLQTEEKKLDLGGTKETTAINENSNEVNTQTEEKKLKLHGIREMDPIYVNSIEENLQTNKEYGMVKYLEVPKVHEMSFVSKTSEENWRKSEAAKKLLKRSKISRCLNAAGEEMDKDLNNSCSRVQVYVPKKGSSCPCGSHHLWDCFVSKPLQMKQRDVKDVNNNVPNPQSICVQKRDEKQNLFDSQLGRDEVKERSKVIENVAIWPCPTSRQTQPANDNAERNKHIILDERKIWELYVMVEGSNEQRSTEVTQNIVKNLYRGNHTAFSSVKNTKIFKILSHCPNWIEQKNLILSGILKMDIGIRSAPAVAFATGTIANYFVVVLANRNDVAKDKLCLPSEMKESIDGNLCNLTLVQIYDIDARKRVEKYIVKDSPMDDIKQMLEVESCVTRLKKNSTMKTESKMQWIKLTEEDIIQPLVRRTTSSSMSVTAGRELVLQISSKISFTTQIITNSLRHIQDLPETKGGFCDKDNTSSSSYCCPTQKKRPVKSRNPKTQSPHLNNLSQNVSWPSLTCTTSSTCIGTGNTGKIPSHILPQDCSVKKDGNIYYINPASTLPSVNVNPDNCVKINVARLVPVQSPLQGLKAVYRFKNCFGGAISGGSVYPLPPTPSHPKDSTTAIVGNLNNTNMIPNNNVKMKRPNNNVILFPVSFPEKSVAHYSTVFKSSQTSHHFASSGSQNLMSHRSTYQSSTFPSQNSHKNLQSPDMKKAQELNTILQHLPEKSVVNTKVPSASTLKYTFTDRGIVKSCNKSCNSSSYLTQTSTERAVVNPGKVILAKVVHKSNPKSETCYGSQNSVFSQTETSRNMGTVNQLSTNASHFTAMTLKNAMFIPKPKIPVSLSAVHGQPNPHAFQASKSNRALLLNVSGENVSLTPAVGKCTVLSLPQLVSYFQNKCAKVYPPKNEHMILPKHQTTPNVSSSNLLSLHAQKLSCSKDSEVLSVSSRVSSARTAATSDSAPIENKITQPAVACKADHHGSNNRAVQTVHSSGISDKLSCTRPLSVLPDSVLDHNHKINNLPDEEKIALSGKKKNLLNVDVNTSSRTMSNGTSLCRSPKENDAHVTVSSVSITVGHSPLSLSPPLKNGKLMHESDKSCNISKRQAESRKDDVQFSVVCTNSEYEEVLGNSISFSTASDAATCHISLSTALPVMTCKIKDFNQTSNTDVEELKKCLSDERDKIFLPGLPKATSLVCAWDSHMKNLQTNTLSSSLHSLLSVSACSLPSLPTLTTSVASTAVSLSMASTVMTLSRQEDSRKEEARISSRTHMELKELPVRENNNLPSTTVLSKSISQTTSVNDHIKEVHTDKETIKPDDKLLPGPENTCPVRFQIEAANLFSFASSMNGNSVPFSTASDAATCHVSLSTALPVMTCKIKDFNRTSKSDVEELKKYLSDERDKISLPALPKPTSLVCASDSQVRNSKMSTVSPSFQSLLSVTACSLPPFSPTVSASVAPTVRTFSRQEDSPEEVRISSTTSVELKELSVSESNKLPLTTALPKSTSHTTCVNDHVKEIHTDKEIIKPHDQLLHRSESTCPETADMFSLAQSINARCLEYSSITKPNSAVSEVVWSTNTALNSSTLTCQPSPITGIHLSHVQNMLDNGGVTSQFTSLTSAVKKCSDHSEAITTASTNSEPQVASTCVTTDTDDPCLNKIMNHPKHTVACKTAFDNTPVCQQVKEVQTDSCVIAENKIQGQSRPSVTNSHQPEIGVISSKIAQNGKTDYPKPEDISFDTVSAEARVRPMHTSKRISNSKITSSFPDKESIFSASEIVETPTKSATKDGESSVKDGNKIPSYLLQPVSSDSETTLDTNVAVDSKITNMHSTHNLAKNIVQRGKKPGKVSIREYCLKAVPNSDPQKVTTSVSTKNSDRFTIVRENTYKTSIQLQKSCPRKVATSVSTMNSDRFTIVSENPTKNSVQLQNSQSNANESASSTSTMKDIHFKKPKLITKTTTNSSEPSPEVDFVSPSQIVEEVVSTKLPSCKNKTDENKYDVEFWAKKLPSSESILKAGPSGCKTGGDSASSVSRKKSARIRVRMRKRTALKLLQNTEKGSRTKMKLHVINRSSLAGKGLLDAVRSTVRAALLEKSKLKIKMPRATASDMMNVIDNSDKDGEQKFVNRLGMSGKRLLNAIHNTIRVEVATKSESHLSVRQPEKVQTSRNRSVVPEKARKRSGEVSRTCDQPKAKHQRRVTEHRQHLKRNRSCSSDCIAKTAFPLQKSCHFGRPEDFPQKKKLKPIIPDISQKDKRKLFPSPAKKLRRSEKLMTVNISEEIKNQVHCFTEKENPFERGPSKSLSGCINEKCKHDLRNLFDVIIAASKTESTTPRSNECGDVNSKSEAFSRRKNLTLKTRKTSSRSTDACQRRQQPSASMPCIDYTKVEKEIKEERNNETSLIEVNRKSSSETVDHSIIKVVEQSTTASPQPFDAKLATAFENTGISPCSSNMAEKQTVEKLITASSQPFDEKLPPASTNIGISPCSSNMAEKPIVEQSTTASPQPFREKLPPASKNTDISLCGSNIAEEQIKKGERSHEIIDLTNDSATEDNEINSDCSKPECREESSAKSNEKQDEISTSDQTTVAVEEDSAGIVPQMNSRPGSTGPKFMRPDKEREMLANISVHSIPTALNTISRNEDIASFEKVPTRAPSPNTEEDVDILSTDNEELPSVVILKAQVKAKGRCCPLTIKESLPTDVRKREGPKVEDLEAVNKRDAERARRVEFRFQFLRLEELLGMHERSTKFAILNTATKECQQLRLKEIRLLDEKVKLEKANEANWRKIYEYGLKRSGILTVSLNSNFVKAEIPQDPQKMDSHVIPHS